MAGTPFNTFCPCGARLWRETEGRKFSAVLQITALGVTPRLRARAITVAMCLPCAAAIHLNTGRKLRKALAAAVRVRVQELAAEMKGKGK